MGPLRRRLVKHLFRKHLRQLAADPNTSADDSRMVDTLLDHHDAFSAAADDLIDRIEAGSESLALPAAEQDAMLSKEAAGGGFTNFLQWLLDHKDALLALIREIIAMFGL